MKLKKIASLALAGVMSVSMLAGCATKAPETNDGEGEGQVETALSIVNVLNQAQSKVKFTNNDVMNAALQAMLADKGLGFLGSDKGVNAIETALKGVDIKETPDTVTKYSGFASGFDATNYADWQKFCDADLTGLLNGAMDYYYQVDSSGMNSDAAAGTYVAVKVKAFDGYADANAAAKAMAAYMEKLTEKLADHSTMTIQTEDQSYGKGGANMPGEVVKGYELQYNNSKANKYYTYSYAGNASVITVNNVNGTTSYILVYVINQDVEVAEFKG